MLERYYYVEGFSFILLFVLMHQLLCTAINLRDHAVFPVAYEKANELRKKNVKNVN